MAGTLESRTLSVRIEKEASAVYDFVSLPENFARWASGLGDSLACMDGEWRADTPQGLIKIRFTERNSYGVADHYVTPEGGPEISIPMRVIANGKGSELLFTLFRQPDMSQEVFEKDADWVMRDLTALKKLLES